MSRPSDTEVLDLLEHRGARLERGLLVGFLCERMGGGRPLSNEGLLGPSCPARARLSLGFVRDGLPLAPGNRCFPVEGGPVFGGEIRRRQEAGGPPFRLLEKVSCLGANFGHEPRWVCVGG